MHRSKYDIVFGGLPKKKHEFYYIINENNFYDFFKTKDYIEKCEIEIKITLNNVSLIKEFVFDITGLIYSFCDTCNKKIILNIKTKQNLILKPNNSDYEDDQIIFIDYNSHKINIIKFVYEYIMLSLPMKKTCEISEEKASCDKNMINEIKKYIYK